MLESEAMIVPELRTGYCPKAAPSPQIFDGIRGGV